MIREEFWKKQRQKKKEIIGEFDFDYLKTITTEEGYETIRQWFLEANGNAEEFKDRFDRERTRNLLNSREHLDDEIDEQLLFNFK